MTLNTLAKGGRIAVIGAGIIGVTSALELAQRGYHVTVFDPHPPGEGGPSRANAGHIGASDIHPLSSPGIVLTGLKLILQKDGPLKIPGLEKLRLLPWFLEFLATARGKKFQDACQAITCLCQSSIPEMERMLFTADMSDLMIKCGAGYIYDNARSLKASQPAWEQKNVAGFGSRAMTANDISAQLPDINPKLIHAMISLNWARVSDPLEIVQGLAKHARTCGVEFRNEKICNLSPEGQKVILATRTSEQQFETVVVAAGIHSVFFAKTLEERLPVVAERGYNLTFPTPDISLDMPLIMPDRGLAITRVNSGLRIGGWAEYASANRPASLGYYDTLSRISAEIFPGLNQAGAVRWMGQRPSLPDSVPVISQSLRAPRVFYNCGHGHLGLTHSAISARILGELVDNAPILPAHKAYSIGRFN